MERGLIWLPLLALFVGLAWAGWNEYQKVQAYRRWSQSADRAKYDIYAVLAQQGNQLTWGLPSRQGPVGLQSLDLTQVRSMQLLVDGKSVSAEKPPGKGRKAALAFSLEDNRTVEIPFTEVKLAAKWFQVLEKDWQQLVSKDT
ncbi:hypothetical protein [Geitlerinema sp. PCC 9228]|uniref:hypothetical protein n=1 Tax=Geitlerinema sp. PCC 9228 TaxID=111611 RepID=UPI0008F9C4AC|nr:hypothetical protein [Geitlerinema sp. PCC 9228]